VKHITVDTKINRKLTKVRDAMVVSDMKRQTFVVSKVKNTTNYMPEKWTLSSFVV